MFRVYLRRGHQGHGRSARLWFRRVQHRRERPRNTDQLGFIIAGAHIYRGRRLAGLADWLVATDAASPRRWLPGRGADSSRPGEADPWAPPMSHETSPQGQSGDAGLAAKLAWSELR